MASRSNNIINSYTTAKDKSLRNSKYLTEYFFLKFQHLYTVALLLTIFIFFVLYLDSEKVPQEYLEIFIGLGALGIILPFITFIWHYKNTKQRNIASRDARDVENQDHIEYVLKIVQHCATFITFLFTVIICGVYLNGKSMPKGISIGIVVISFLTLLFTLIIFGYSFYSVAKRSYNRKIFSELDQDGIPQPKNLR